MHGLMTKRSVCAAALCLLVAAAAPAAQVVSTTARALAAVSNMGGFGLTPNGTQPAGGGDLAPVQLFEITKPANQSVTIGRMFTSCTCVILEADKRTYGPGERAVLRMRNVQATPPGGQSYALYVQITSPISTTLRYDTYVQSAQFVPAPEGAPPTRGNIVADGVYSPSVGTSLAGGASVDVFVPKADNYIPDTSEYTLRKRAEQEAKEQAVNNLNAAKKAAAKPAPAKPAVTVAATASATPAVSPPAAPPAPAKERPQAPAQLRSTIDAAITQAERDLASSSAGRQGDGPAVTADGRTGVEARLDPGLSTEQSAQYQTEARQIAREILHPSERRAPQAAPATGDDELWRKPTPRGRVRSTGSLSTSSRAPSERTAGRTAARPVGSVEETVANALGRVTPVPAATDSAVMPGGSQTVLSGGGRTVTDTIRSGESAIAERAREAAREVGRTVQAQGTAASQALTQTARDAASQAMVTRGLTTQGVADAATSAAQGVAGVADGTGRAAIEVFRSANR